MNRGGAPFSRRQWEPQEPPKSACILYLGTGLSSSHGDDDRRAVCCAAPLIGVLGVAEFTATAVTFAFAGVVFALVVGAATVTALLVRRSHARQAACTPESGQGALSFELGLTRRAE